ncbi:MAG TPA: cytochrome c oxidase subunit II [Acetobacteraceae bacterium]|jgi:cytochrome c oxidase subunit 2|nr:cytochrome c oxidase subunit II [Acetobacteraceae bacterium]
MHFLRRWSAAVAAPVFFFGAHAPHAWAQMPHNWQIGLQAAHSPVKAEIDSLNTLVLVIITVITAFVAGLMAYTVWRFHHSRNLTPSRTSHNTVIEIAWTVVPVLILVIIAIPSFRLVYYEDRATDADMTLKVTGHQWYWEYTYPDKGNIDFSSYLVPDDQLKPGQPRLLTADNQLVLPAGKTIRILTTSADVIHSFFIPSLGVQRYAIPGRTIETWVKIDEPGDYYGQCNQICGTNHDSMPISVHAVSPAEFDTWLAQAKTKFAGGAAAAPAAPIALAQATPAAVAAVQH